LRIQAHIQISETDATMEPNLIWSDMDAKDTDNEENDNGGTLQQQQCSLLDIASVYNATNTMMEDLTTWYPYVKFPNNCLLLQLNDGTTHLFEAKDATDAKKVIHGLRWIVARFSFNLIMGNRMVCTELLPNRTTRIRPLAAPQSFLETTPTDDDGTVTSVTWNSVTNQLVEKSLEKLQTNY